MSCIEKGVIEEIIRTAQRAPSGDNMQPWTFRVSSDVIEAVFNEKETMDSIVYSIPPVFPGDAISFGALAENMVLAAAGHNLSAEVQSVSETGKVEMRILLRNFPPEYDPLAEKLATRSTDRRPFSQETIDDAILASAESSAASFGGEILWINSLASRRHFGKLAEEFERILWNNPVLRKYISGSMRFKKDAKEGITLIHMGLGWRRWFFPFFFSVTKRFPILFYVLGIFSGWNMRGLSSQSAAIGVLVLNGSGEKRRTYFDGGRALERLWVSLNANGIAFQPIYGLVGTIFNQRSGVGGFSEREAAWQKEAIHDLETLFPGLASKTPIIFFRIGKQTSAPLPPVPHHDPCIIWND